MSLKDYKMNTQVDSKSIVVNGMVESFIVFCKQQCEENGWTARENAHELREACEKSKLYPTISRAWRDEAIEYALESMI